MHEAPGSLGRAVGPIALLVLIIFFNLTARTIFSPLLPMIEQDLGLSHAQAAGFFLLISLGYSFSMFLSGFVSSALRHRGTILLSVFATATALGAIALAGSLTAMRLAMISMGVAVGLYLPSGVATVTGLVAREHWGKAVAMHEMGPNLSFVLAPLIAELLIRATPWRGVLAVVAAGGLAAGGLFAVLGRGGRFPGAPPNPANLRPILAAPSFWIITALGCMAAATTIGVFSVLPVYLISEKGMERTAVNTLVSASRVSGVIMVFVVGWMVDRLGPRRLMAAIGAVVSALTVMMGLTDGAWLAAAVFLQPMLTGSFFPALLSALARISPPHAQNVGVSLMVPFVFFFGGGVVPALMGVLAEGTGFWLGFVSLGVLFTVLLPLLLLVRLPGGPA